MSCCGQKHAAPSQREQSSFNLDRAAVPPPSTELLAPEYRVRYLGPDPLSLSGMSGRIYYFDRAGSAGPVAAADYDALLRTGLFEADLA